MDLHLARTARLIEAREALRERELALAGRLTDLGALPVGDDGAAARHRIRIGGRGKLDGAVP